MSDKVIQGNQYQATISGQDFVFTINNENLERFFNAINRPNDRIAAFNNLLVSTVNKDQKEQLVALVKDDLLLLMKLLELFSELLNTPHTVEVKKL